MERRSIASLSIIMPALNEEGSLKGAVADVRGTFSDGSVDWEIILINDGSTDNTYRIACELAREARIKVIHNYRPMGIGYCLKRGILASEKEAITWFPCDRENDPHALARGITLLKNSDMVVPFVCNPDMRSLIRRILSVAYRWTINFSFGTRFKYTNGTIIYRRKVFDIINPKSNGFFFHAECLIKAVRSGASFVEVPVILNKRVSGQAKALSFKSIKSVIKDFLSFFIEVNIKDKHIRYEGIKRPK